MKKLRLAPPRHSPKAEWILRNNPIGHCLLLVFLTSLAQATSVDLPSAGWSVNNWRKTDATASWRITQTPAGQVALEIAFEGKHSPTVVSPSLAQISRSWPNEFGSLGMYVRGDGSGQLLTVQFVADSHT